MPTILIKKSDTPGAAPTGSDLTNLAGGAEIAVNTADKRVFSMNSSSAIIELGTNPGSLTTADASATVFRSGSATITDLIATSASITTLTATSASVTNLTATSLVLSNLSIASANVTTLTSGSATITNLLATSLTVSSGSTLNGGVVVNELGADVDFRVEGDTDSNLLFVDASTDRVGVGTNAPAEKVDIGSGNLTFSSTAQRITGDMSNATLTNRLAIQSNTTNGNTAVTVLPNGTSTTAQILAYNNSDPTNASNIAVIATSTATRLSSGQSGSGTYLPLTFFTNGAEKARLDTSGNLGLGVTPSAWETTSSSTAFQFNGSYLYGYRDVGLYIGNNAYYDGAWKYYASSRASTRYDMAVGTFAWNIAPAGTAGGTISFTQAMTLTADGDLALGVSSPRSGYRLDIRESTDNGVNIQAGDGGTDIALSIGSAGTADKFVFTAGGDLGVGTSSPGSFAAENDSKLTVGTGSGNTGAITLYSATTGHGAINWADGTSGAATYAGILRYDHSANAMQFYTNGLNERARITSGGDLLVGTTSSYAKFHVKATTAADVLYRLESYSNSYASKLLISSTSSGDGGIRYGNGGGNNLDIFSYGDMRFYCGTANIGGTVGDERARIASGGQFCINTTNTNGILNVNGEVYLFAQPSGAGNSTLKYNSATGQVTYDASSRLVKENIVDSTYGLAEVLQLKSRKYFRKDDQREEIGFVADEMQEVLPEFVPMAPKSVFTGNEEDTELVPSAVNYDKLTSVLVKAIQEQQAMIEDLKAKVAALEAK